MPDRAEAPPAGCCGPAAPAPMHGTTGTPLTWSAGRWLEGNPPLLGPMDHSWWMASSVFDGARAFGRLAPDLDRHCRRVVASARTFGMKPALDAPAIEALCWEGIERFAPEAELYIRPMFYFTGGFVMPDYEATEFILTVFEAPMPEWRGVTACRAPFRRPAPDMAPTNAKASCLYPNVSRSMAAAREKGYDTAVVLDALGNVAEFSTNNLFVASGKAVRTPAANGAFLAGITRARVVELLAGAGVAVEQAALTMDDVLAADEVFLTGNYAKVLPVTRVEDRDYEIGPVSLLARRLYMEFAERDGRRRAA